MKCNKCNHEYADHLEMCPVCGEPNKGPVDLTKEASREPDEESVKAEQAPEGTQKASATGSGTGSTQGGSSQYSWNAQQGGSSSQPGGSYSQYGGASQRGSASSQYGTGPQQGGSYSQYGNSSQQGGSYSQYGNSSQQGGSYSQYGQSGNRHPVAVLVLGILSILLPVIGAVLGIIAIVLGNTARKESTPGTTDYSMATAGWIMGIISVAIWGALLVFGIIVASVATTAALSFVDGIGHWFGSGALPAIFID